jgi:hypothetical protein
MTDEHQLTHLNMLCLLYKQHRPITLLYIAIHYVHDANDFHLILVSLSLEDGGVSAQALYVLIAPVRLADQEESAGCKGSVDRRKLLEYCS